MNTENQAASQCRSVQSQLSAYFDNELTQQDSQRVRVHIESCNQCQGMLDDFQAMKTNMGNLHYSRSEEDLVDKVLNDAPSKLFALVGWIAVIVGYIGFLVWQLVVFYTNSGVPTFAKIGVALLELGFLALLISVARQRFVESKTDKYKKVKL